MRMLIILVSLTLPLISADNLIVPEEWKLIPNLTSESKDGAVTIRTESETYGEYRQHLNISATFPKKVRISFRYWTKSDMPANASFAFSWSFIDQNGAAIAKNSSYNKLPAAITGKRMLFSTDVPAEAAKMLVKFQPQGPKDGKFITSYATISDFAVIDDGPSKEALMLIAKPLTQSDAVKRWPNTPLRGLGIISVASVGNNMQNPGEFITEETFRKFSQWGVNCVRVEVRFETGGIWDVKR